MANVLTENFEGGTSGAKITTGNLPTATFVQGAPTFFATSTLEGSLCARFNASGAAVAVTLPHDSSATQWVSGYFYVAALPAANAYVLEWQSSASAKILDMRVQPNGTLVVRNESSTAAITSTTSVTAGAWHRLAIRHTASSQIELRMYVGANLHGSVPDWSGTAAITPSTQAGRLIVGAVAAATIDVRFDRIRVDDAAEPESMIPAGVPLDAPAITATTTNPSTIGGTDGAVTVNMPVAVTGAATYEVRRLNASAVVQETVQRTFAQFPHTFTGRPAETGSVDVQAKP